MSMPRVQVLLATCDGSTFLDEQLASLAAQNGVVVDLVVLDDASTDDTMLVLERWAPRLPMRVEQAVGRLGLPATYLWLLAHADADRDAWAFCDQDDVWEPDKLSRAVAALSPFAGRTPTLWVCGQEVVSEEGGAEMRAPSSSRTDFGNALVETLAPGCCMVWNGDLMTMVSVPEADEIVMHDAWMYASATAVGQVLTDDRPLVRYRLHDGNAVGLDRRLTSRVRRHLASTDPVSASWETQAQAAIDAYGTQLTMRESQGAEAMARGTLRERWRAWRDGSISRSRGVENVLLLFRLVLVHPSSRRRAEARRRRAQSHDASGPITRRVI